MPKDFVSLTQVMPCPIMPSFPHPIFMPKMMPSETSPIKKRPSLEQVMSYKNDYIVGSFLKTFAVSDEEANEIFNQVKAMFWLVNEMEHEGFNSEKNSFSIDNSLLILDEMWHTFILCTREYEHFCRETFGNFIHHFPTVETEETKAERAAKFAGLSREQVVAEVMNEKRWQYTYVFKKLGQATFLKWYTEFNGKYTSKSILELRKNKILESEPVETPEISSELS